MKLRSQSSFALLAVLASTAVYAQTSAPMPASASAPAPATEPSYTLSANVGVVTDYRFRGLTQTSYNPALQGGVDFSHKSGLYVGVWGSNVQWIKDYVGATKGELEVDIYGGYKGSITKDLSFDVGAIAYQYPDNTTGKVTGYKNADTTEVYVALTYSVVTAKYSYSTDNFIANSNSTGARYLEVAATFDLGSGYSLTPHAGYQTVPNQSPTADYSDYALTLGKDFGNGWSASAAAVATVNADQTFYFGAPNGKLVSKNGMVLGVKYTF